MSWFATTAGPIQPTTGWQHDPASLAHDADPKDSINLFDWLIVDKKTRPAPSKPTTRHTHKHTNTHLTPKAYEHAVMHVHAPTETKQSKTHEPIANCGAFHDRPLGGLGVPPPSQLGGDMNPGDVKGGDLNRAGDRNPAAGSCK